MDFDNIKIAFNHLNLNGWDNDPCLSILIPFGWVDYDDGEGHVWRDGKDIRFTEDALMEELGIEIHHYHELVGSYTLTGDILGVLERWLHGE